MPDTPVATPQGYRPVCKMRRSDTILTPEGETVSVLHVLLSRQVPACHLIGSTTTKSPIRGRL